MTHASALPSLLLQAWERVKAFFFGTHELVQLWWSTEAVLDFAPETVGAQTQALWDREIGQVYIHGSLAEENQHTSQLRKKKKAGAVLKECFFQARA